MEPKKHHAPIRLTDESIIGGTITLENAPAIKQYLQEQEKQGNGFVVFEGRQSLTEYDLTALKTLPIAIQYSYENAIPLTLRSIPQMLYSVDEILERAKEQEKQADRPTAQHFVQPEQEKRSRDEGLSR